MADSAWVEHEFHLRLALEAGGLGTWRWDMPTGEIHWDERLEELYGLEAGTFPGTYAAYLSLIHPDDRDEVQRTVRDAVAEGRQYRVEHRVVWPDGTVRWIGGTGGPTFGPDGEVTGTIGCVGDVTDRIERELHHRERLDRATLTAENERVQRERLEFLAAINDALNNSTSVEQIMKSVTALAVPRLGDWCAVHLLPENGRGLPDVEVSHADPEREAEANELRERFRNDPASHVGVPYVIETRRTEYVPDIDDATLAALGATDDERALVEQLGLRSSITTPIIKRNKVLGAMQFVMAHSSRHYTPDDVTLAEAVAGRIAASIDNRRLQERQRQIAHTLQASLLPPKLPAVPGIRIAVRYWAAGEGTEVGGDFYDVFAVDGDKWAVVIGDVCGTGPAAAALTGLARHTIRTSVWRGDDQIESLRVLNHAILRSEVTSFCTIVLGSLRPAERGAHIFEMTCGGHPLPILVSGGIARPVGRPGTLVGCLRDIRCTTDEVTLAPGDTLVLFTDGATDVPGDAALDATQFTELIRDATGGDAESTADNIHKSLEAIRPFHQRHDDLALLIIEVPDPD